MTVDNKDIVITSAVRTAIGNLAVRNIEEFFKTGKCKNKIN